MQSCVDRQVMTPNQEILMRFELHTVTLIPIISQLPPARLACWPHSTSVGAERLLQAAFLLSLKLQHSVGQPLWPPHLPGFPCDWQGAAALVMSRTDSVTSGWRLLWDVCGGVWWNPAVLGAKPDWQWTLAASPENNIIFVRSLNGILVTVNLCKQNKVTGS